MAVGLVVGDMVRLKSGGPMLTVVGTAGTSYIWHCNVGRVVQPDYVLCSWFAEQTHYQDVFPEVSLKVYSSRCPGYQAKSDQRRERGRQ